MSRPFVLVAAGLIRPALRELLVARGHEVRDVARPAELTDDADLVVLGLPDALPGSVWLHAARRRVGVPVFVVGTDGGLRGPVDARELGATEHFTPDAPGEEILAAIGVALGARRHDAHLRYLQQKDEAQAALSGLLGESPGITRVRASLRRLAESAGAAPTVLFTGETGSGKGLVAKALHYAGARRRQPFVDVNCAAIPASLIEAELFGHAKGTFTGALGERPGLFETAHRGTLFLDEIGSMPSNLQGTLLKALEDKRVRRLGEREGRTVDVQVFAATHEDLDAKVRDGSFRADLLHRLDVVRIALPPLRSRGEDKLVLAHAFLAEACSSYGVGPRTFSSAAAAAIVAYSFPGNVRELKNVVERAVLLQSSEVVEVEDLGLPGTEPVVEVESDGESGIRVRLPSSSFSLDALEKAALVAALDRHEGNVSRAARYLRIGRQKLIYRMRKYGIR
ncbi:MAG: sigma-54-dependent Fis family transcriptional regulator [Sandaracinus sp.]|nr:sigma-54-dependent Fis family transcriptional regulator [Sandaracinus sp.]MCB9634551.1 sigma-54-dependent Fis family transcriptional regulator [Sandaracinus sp.]